MVHLRNHKEASTGAECLLHLLTMLKYFSEKRFVVKYINLSSLEVICLFQMEFKNGAKQQMLNPPKTFYNIVYFDLVT